MICADAGPLGRTVEYPEFWMGVITGPSRYGSPEVIIPTWLIEDTRQAYPHLDVRLVHS